VLTAPMDKASHGSSRGQAELLLEALGATAEQRALIKGAFPAAA
jgi:hypothetical protein